MDKEVGTHLTVERLIEILQDRDPQALVALGERKEAPGAVWLITAAHKDGDVFEVHEIWQFIKKSIEEQ